MRPLDPILPLATIAMGCGGFSLGQHVGRRVVQVKVSPGGGSNHDGSAGSGGVEEVVVVEGGSSLFDGEAMTTSPTRLHRDAVVLGRDNEERAADVKAILWMARDSRCGASVGSHGKFCFARDCGILSHATADTVPVPGCYYVPVNARSFWAFASPTVRDRDLSEEFRRLLERPRDPGTLKAVIAEINAGIQNGVDESLTRQAVQNTVDFEERFRPTMAFTPGRPLREAAAAREDQETAVLVTERLMERFVPGSAGSDEFVDAASTAITDFPQVDAALGNLEDRIKAVETAVGEAATGLNEALHNLQSLSKAVSGSYKSFDTRLGRNFDTNAYVGAWDGILHIKEKLDTFEALYKSQEVLTKQRQSANAHDIAVYSKRLGELGNLANRLESRLNEARIGTVLSGDTNTLVPSFLPDSIDGRVHPLFYHLGFGIDHFFNKLDFGIDKYDRALEEAGIHSGGGRAANTQDEVDALKDEIGKLQAAMRKLQAPDHGSVLSVGAYDFQGQEELVEFLEELNEKEPLPPGFWGLCYDMWHFSDRLAILDGVQKTESEVADEAYKMSRLKQSASQMRIRAGIKRFAPVLFEPAGTGKSQETKQPFTSLKKPKHWFCSASQSGRWFHARTSVTPLHKTIHYEIDDMLGAAEHKPLREIFKEMSSDAKDHLHATTQWMSNTMEEESQDCRSGEEAAWFYVTTAMTGFIKELRKQRYCVLDEDVPDLSRNVQLGAKVIWALGKARKTMQEISEAQFVAHQICVAATGRYMNLSRATKTSVEALDTRMEEELKKIRKQLNKKE